MKTYRDLTVWQKSVELVEEVYIVTRKFPKEEIYGLTSQMRRAAVSIPSNIAEGKLRGSNQQMKQFLLIASGSGGELETQIEIAKRLHETKLLDYSRIEILLGEIMKVLNVFITKLEPSA
ncbi:four helix bundle protein [Candidatus Wolfebacteria bacterium]|nr:four helix bundle protein [Candidatus Wolfebacteria bacterium]